MQQHAARSLSTAWAAVDPAAGGIACLHGKLTDAAARAVAKQAAVELSQAPQPLQAVWMYRMGQALCLSGDYTAAAAALAEAAKMRPTNPLAALERGFALEKACPPIGACENGENAASAWRAAEISPAQFTENGTRFRSKEQYAQALLWYERAQHMGTDLRSAIAYTQYQEATQLKETEKAFTALQSAVQIDAGWVDEQLRFMAWYQLGRELANRQDNTNAENTLRRALAIHSDKTEIVSLSEAYLFLGLVLVNDGRLDEALGYLKRSVEIFPRNPWAHIHYGKFLYQKDPANIVQTEEEFAAAVLLAKKDAAIWNNLVANWQQMGQPGQAMELCRQAEEAGMTPSELNACAQTDNEK